MIKVTLKDGSSLEVENGISILEVAKKLVKGLQEMQLAEKLMEK